MKVVRFKNGERFETDAEPCAFGSERAKEIIHLGNQWSNYAPHMTDGEIAYTHTVWAKMQGWTSFYDALCRIANHDKLIDDLVKQIPDYPTQEGKKSKR